MKNTIYRVKMKNKINGKLEEVTFFEESIIVKRKMVTQNGEVTYVETKDDQAFNSEISMAKRLIKRSSKDFEVVEIEDNTVQN
jgi:disulfide oxidoreductase YuzD